MAINCGPLRVHVIRSIQDKNREGCPPLRSTGPGPASPTLGGGPTGSIYSVALMSGAPYPVLLLQAGAQNYRTNSTGSGSISPSFFLGRL